MTAGETQKLKVFISYSRDDLEFADQLCAALEATGFAPTLDRIGISGAADWRETLKGMILKSDTVVFVLSPSSARSEMCAEEVAVADSLAKRIIPVVCQPLLQAPVPKRLQDLNYIFFYPEPKSPGSGFGAGLGKLKEALETDMGWMREHTRYEDRATEWDAGGRVPERLLLGADILQAQKWTTAKPAYAPDPTALQVAYIDASVKADTERLAAQTARDAIARDGEIKRIRAEQEADRLRLDTAKIAAERAAAQAESRQRRSQLLISLPAVVLALGGAAGFYIQKQQAQLSAQILEIEKSKAEKEAAEAALLRLQVNQQKSLNSVQQSVRVSGPTGKTEVIQVAEAPTPVPPPAVASAPSPAPSQPPGRAGDSGGSGGASTSSNRQQATSAKISDDAADLMAAFEIGDKLTYERRLGQPTWPGAQSGVVIGIGYDLGYVTAEECARNWQRRLKQVDYERLMATVGVKGPAAKELADKLSDISIPYDVAKDQFQTQSLPQYTARTVAAFPNASELPADALGALVSLVYNRGSSFAGDARAEMRTIRELMDKREFAGVPAQLRAMKRLWPTIDGLQRRREAEAVLFEKGLAEQTLQQKQAKSKS